MCGLIAHFARGGRPVGPDDLPALLAGRDAMARRGPDGDGLWSEGEAALGHRRLAIVDLDPRAAQPMHSPCGRYVLAFNGEIYNYPALRAELAGQGVVFTTTSDTEVILALFARDGEAMLDRLRGMFALVIWDRQARRGFVARDPYGIKPLYLGTAPDGLWVGSQVKGLMATGRIDDAVSPEGQRGFWLLGSVPEPWTWRRDIRALPAGSCAWIENGAVVSERRWRDVGDAWRDATVSAAPTDDIQDRVAAALRESVERHLVADVPVGVFLSGGIDSSAVAALMVEAGARDVLGVTLAFDEFAGTARDEAPAAAEIAGRYGLHHHVRRVARDEFQHDLPRVLAAMDQPSIDGVNTWYAAKAAAECGLKVVMSGVGGDELFQGYSTFNRLPPLVRAWGTAARIPGARALAGLATGRQAARSGNARWRHAPDWLRSIQGAWWLARSLHAPGDLADLMQGDATAAAFDVRAEVTAMTGPLPSDLRLALGQIESMTYLRNQLLRDADWASMDHSLELRTPLVDAHLLDTLAPLLPRFAGYPGKALLARAPRSPLPEAVTGRTKTGFGIPSAQWLFNDVSDEGTGSRRWARTAAETYGLAG